jgi:hypothetical protein
MDIRIGAITVLLLVTVVCLVARKKKEGLSAGGWPSMTCSGGPCPDDKCHDQCASSVATCLNSRGGSGSTCQAAWDACVAACSRR